MSNPKSPYLEMPSVFKGMAFASPYGPALLKEGALEEIIGSSFTDDYILKVHGVPFTFPNLFLGGEEEILTLWFQIWPEVLSICKMLVESFDLEKQARLVELAKVFNETSQKMRRPFSWSIEAIETETVEIETPGTETPKTPINSEEYQRTMAFYRKSNVLPEHLRKVSLNEQIVKARAEISLIKEARKVLEVTSLKTNVDLTGILNVSIGVIKDNINALSTEYEEAREKCAQAYQDLWIKMGFDPQDLHPNPEESLTVTVSIIE